MDLFAACCRNRNLQSGRVMKLKTCGLAAALLAFNANLALGSDIASGALGFNGLQEDQSMTHALEISEDAWVRRSASVSFNSEDTEQEAPAGGDQASLEEMAKKSANPIGDVWMLWFQNDTTRYDGDLPGLSHEWANTTVFQPVMSFPVLGGDWNLVVRPVFQYASVPLDKSVGRLLNANQGSIVSNPGLSAIAADPFGRTSGLGDTALLTILGPNREDGVVWALGASQIFPTAAEDVLGQGKYQVGPAFLLAKLAKESGGNFWNCTNFGFLGQHWWSVAGDSDRSYTSQSNIQYFINYRINATDMIGMTPNIRIDWSRDDFDDMVTFPVGLGYSTVRKVGKLPIRFVAEAQYSVFAPDDVGSSWNFRFMVIPIIANPFK